jgi:hypothetical protein
MELGFDASLPREVYNERPIRHHRKNFGTEPATIRIDLMAFVRSVNSAARSAAKEVKEFVD